MVWSLIVVGVGHTVFICFNYVEDSSVAANLITSFLFGGITGISLLSMAKFIHSIQVHRLNDTVVSF